jgi:hypothetical protein
MDLDLRIDLLYHGKTMILWHRKLSALEADIIINNHGLRTEFIKGIQ